MDVVILLLVCSLVLVAGSIVLFVFSARQGDCHEAERLCLMPLEDDEGGTPAPPTAPVPPTSPRRTSDD